MKQPTCKRSHRSVCGGAGRALALSLGVLAAGAAWPVVATIPDANGLLHGCRQMNNGQLRLIDPAAGETCYASEVPVTWNQVGPQGTTGPQGPQGPVGPQGPQGPAGASGTSQAFYAFNSHIVDVEGDNFDVGVQEIVGLTLPAGSYVIWTTLYDRPGEDDALCQVLKNNAAPVNLPSASFFVFGDTTTTTTVALTSPSTFVITADCIDPGDFFGIHHHPTIDGVMTAILVDQVN
jgi:hypothetical protein